MLFVEADNLQQVLMTVIQGAVDIPDPNVGSNISHTSSLFIVISIVIISIIIIILAFLFFIIVMIMQIMTHHYNDINIIIV